jgi:hypothetical protein
MSIDCASFVHQPEEVLPELAAFLGLEDRLDVMSTVIDQSIYHAPADVAPASATAAQ